VRLPRLCKRGIGTGQMSPDTALVTHRRERSHQALVRRFQKRTRGSDCTHRFRGHESVRGSGMSTLVDIPGASAAASMS
jgi:hypothetical protein